jgi:hypothetical protein
MTMKMATAVARVAMIKTNRRISRCNVVIDDDAAEESFAIRPLRAAPFIETLDTGRDRKYTQDSVVTNLEDKPETGSADAQCPLKSNILCLKSSASEGRIRY